MTGGNGQSLGEKVLKIRSKNAGPFWVTVDIFCGDRTVYDELTQSIETAHIAALFDTEPSAIRRFTIAPLNVIKFSVPRPVVQGSRFDRDMHGAQWAELLAEMTV